MDRLFICRICLNINVSHLIPDTQLKEVYEKLTSVSNAIKPSLVCYICHAQLHNAHRLMMKCLKAEEILPQMLNQLVPSKEQTHESLTINEPEFTQLICTAINHIDIEPLFTFEEVLVDFKTEVESEEDIPEPVDDVHQAVAHSGVDDALTRFDSEDDVPLNNVRQETETVTDTQTITTVVKIEPIGWEEGTPVANKSKLEAQTHNPKANKFEDNTDSVKSAVAPNRAVMTSMSSVKTEISTTWEGTTDKDKDNKHIGVVKSENEYNQWSDSFEIPCNEEYIAETLNGNESDVSDEDRDNKKNKDLMTSNVNDASIIENCDQNITFSYLCQESDMNDFKQCKISQNNIRNAKGSTKDSHLVRHSENEIPFICHICRKNYSCKSELKRHVRTHTGERPYSCKICDKTFTLADSLEVHKHMHIGGNPFSCKICHKKFPHKRNLKMHERIHTGDRPYSCKICDKRFTRKTHLKSHEHMHTGERPYSCKICDKRFTRISHLKSHESVHTGEGPYICKICEKRFTYISVLRSHERTHTGERPYSCKICDKTFTLIGNLKIHERIHTGERPYSCKICGKTFTFVGNLKAHERIHTGERPYSCKVCDKTFISVGSLKNHERIHTGERPYSCKVCDKRFANKSNTNKHEYIHTSDRS